MSSNSSKGKYCRGVWREGDEVYEDTFPRNWIQPGKILRWPRETRDLQIKNLILHCAEPEEDWYELDFIKIKMSDDDYELCKAYDFATDTDQVDEGSPAPNLMSSTRMRTPPLPTLSPAPNFMSSTRIRTPPPLPTFVKKTKKAASASCEVQEESTIKEKKRSRESTAARVKESPKVKKRKHIISSDSEDEIEERQSQPPRLDIPSSKSFSRLVPTSLRLGSTYKSNVPKRTTDAHQHRPTHQSTSSSTHSGASDLDNSSTTFDWKRLKSRFPLEEGEFQRKVMTSLIQILEAVQRNGSAASTAAACVNLDDPVTIMSSSAKVEKFSKSLEKDKELYRKVVEHLSRVGGGNVVKVVNNILDRLMTNTCQREFNLVGRKDKKGITKLRIFDAVVDAVAISLPKSTRDQIRTAIGNYLKAAKWRKQDSAEAEAETESNEEVVDEHDELL